MPPLHPSYKETFATIIPELRGWRSTIDVKTQDQQMEHYIKESDNLLTEEDIELLETSPPYRQCIAAFEKARMSPESLVLSDFIVARDLLLVRFSFSTGTRPGALNNAKVDDYLTAREERGNKIVLVTRHKRSKDGPAMLGMNEDLQELMHLYIVNIRPQFAKEGEKSLFIKNDGEGFPKGTIGKRFTTFWEKSGVKKGQTISQHRPYLKNLKSPPKFKKSLVTRRKQQREAMCEQSSQQKPPMPWRGLSVERRKAAILHQSPTLQQIAAMKKQSPAL